MTPEVPLSGTIRETRLPALLRMLQRKEMTGILNLYRNDLDKSIYLKGGEIIFATSKYADDRLGEMLLKLGKITFSQFEASVALLKGSGKRLGTILVEQGFLTPKDLFSGVTFQVKEIILSLFTWIDGNYRFTPGPLPSEELITLKMSTANLILEGIRRIADWTRLSAELPPLDRRLFLTSDPMDLFQSMDMDPKESELVGTFNGQTIQEVLNRSTLPSFDTLKLLYFAISVGIAAAKDPDTPQELEQPVVERVIPDELKEKVFHREAEPSLGLQEIKEAYNRIETQNYYEILGVGPQATREEIKHAYFRLAKAYHPDRHFEEGFQNVKGELEELFSKITEAYDSLTDGAKRSAYDARLANPSREGNTQEPDPGSQTQIYFRQGKEAFDRKDFKKAAYFFETAIKIQPKNHSFYSSLGKSLLQLPDQLHKAEEAFRQAISLAPKNIDLYITLAELYEKKGLLRRALKEYEDALKLDPRNATLKEHLLRLRKKT
jgi:curved DNA-binding protein CbpA